MLPVGIAILVLKAGENLRCQKDNQGSLMSFTIRVDTGYGTRLTVWKL